MRYNEMSSDPKVAAAAWRETLGVLPFIRRSRVKRMIAGLARNEEWAWNASVREQKKTFAVRKHASQAARDHVPNMNRVIDQLRVGSMSSSGVSEAAACVKCQTFWPCETYRLAKDMYLLANGREVQQYPRTFTISVRPDESDKNASKEG